MNLRFIKSAEKKEILAELEEIYGIDELPLLLIEAGKQKIRGFSGSLSKEEIILLGHTVNVETIGAYILSHKDEALRLSFDSLPLFRDQIKKSIIEINEQQLDDWFHGRDLEIPFDENIVILKF